MEKIRVIPYLDNSMGRAQELDKLGHNSAADNLVDGGVALLGKKLAEASCGSELIVHVVGHDTLNHGWKLLVELVMYIEWK